MSAEPIVIHLVRHGVAKGAVGKCIGHADLPLSGEGADSIRTLARTWATSMPVAVLSSGLQRADASADILADRIGVGTPCREVDGRLKEMSFGEWEGRTWAEIQQKDGSRMDAWMSKWTHARVPGGEGFVDVRERVGRWADDGCNRWRAGDQVVVVAHAGSIRALLSHWLGFTAEEVFALRVDHGRASAVGLRAELGGLRAELQYQNSSTFSGADR